MLQTNQNTALADGSDAPAIHLEAESRLRASSYLELHNLRCFYRAGVLILMGCVSRYYLWQVALALVQELDGVDVIDNQVTVINAAASRNS